MTLKEADIINNCALVVHRRSSLIESVWKRNKTERERETSIDVKYSSGKLDQEDQVPVFDLVF